MTDDLAIPEFLDRSKGKPLVGSFTMMNCYQNTCAHQAYHLYVAKTVPWVATPEKNWGNVVHEAFEKRIGGGKPLPAEAPGWNKEEKKVEPFNMQVWEPFAAAFDDIGAQVEVKLGVTANGSPCGFFDNNVRFRNRCDVIIMNGDRAHISDWKTGGSKYEDPFELAVGALHIQAKYPNVRTISGNYIWLRENRVGKPYDLSNTLDTWKQMNHILNSMEQARFENNWPKKQGPLCGWCDVKSCEHNRKLAG